MVAKLIFATFLTVAPVLADTVNYTYDDAGRLTTITYDKAGNLLNRAVATVSSASTPSSSRENARKAFKRKISKTKEP